MVRRNEVILENANVENVFRYLLDKLRGLGGEVINRTADDGTIYMYTIQSVVPSTPNKIQVKYTTTTMPGGDLEKSYGAWGDLIAMGFECLQLQTNTVLVRAACELPFIVSIFDAYWADVLKAFGVPQPASTIADNQGGTLIYSRNEQGQTIVTGGTLNPGYKFEIGQTGVAIKPEERISLNHTTGAYQPGQYPASEKDGILKVMADTLGTLAQNASLPAASAMPESSRKKRGAQLETESSLRRLREIRHGAITSGHPIPTKAAAMDEAGITDKTWKKYDADLWARWDDKSYTPEKQ
jgi:hypothetical protein